MSCNRENVIWKSRNGSWNRGYFDYYQTGEDYEWDVEYNHDRFNWVATGLASKEEANLAQPGANPGGYELQDTPNADTDRYDQMAADYQTAMAAERKRWGNTYPRLG